VTRNTGRKFIKIFKDSGLEFAKTFATNIFLKFSYVIYALPLSLAGFYRKK